jgi:hypothetical protein
MGVRGSTVLIRVVNRGRRRWLSSAAAAARTITRRRSWTSSSTSSPSPSPSSRSKNVKWLRWWLVGRKVGWMACDSELTDQHVIRHHGKKKSCQGLWTNVDIRTAWGKKWLAVLMQQVVQVHRAEINASLTHDDGRQMLSVF